MSFNATPASYAGQPFPTGEHTVDGDTVAHWSFDNVVTCDVSAGNDFNDPNHAMLFQPMLPGSSTYCLNGSSSQVSVRCGVAAGYVAGLTPMGAVPFTAAACVRHADPESNQIIFKHSADNGGFTEACVVGQTWSGIYAGQAVSFSSYETATYTGGTAAFERAKVPIGEWYWLAWTQNADGKSGQIWTARRNGHVEKVAWSTTLASRTGVTGRWSVFNNWNDVRNYSSIYSFILKNITCSDAQLDAMRAQCGF